MTTKIDAIFLSFFFWHLNPNKQEQSSWGLGALFKGTSAMNAKARESAVHELLQPTHFPADPWNLFSICFNLEFRLEPVGVRPFNKALVYHEVLQPKHTTV